jgi:polysaccharide biosynthesis protein PslH
VSKLFQYLNQLRFKDFELGALKRYTAIIAMSELERRLLLAENPHMSVHVVPNGVDAHGISFQPAEDSCRSIIFVASMDSEANHDGAMYCIREIWPRVRASRQDLRLALVGRNPRSELIACHNGDDIVVTGKVNDVFPYYRNAVVAIVPLRSGGGTRLKILEAMAAGTAVVSTSIGCEGLDVEDGKNILVADAPDHFAASIVRLLGDGACRRLVVTEARRLVEEHYDWDLIGQQHDKVYRHAVEHVGS